MTFAIEISNYHPIGKGMLKASFTLTLNPIGLVIRDCKYFMKENGDSWFAFPAKEIIKEGTKSTYMPLISLVNKRYMDELKDKVVSTLNQMSGDDAETNKAIKAEQNDFPF